MSDDKKPLFGTKEVREELRKFLIAQSSIINLIFTKNLGDQKINDIKVLLGSCCQTASAIAALSQNPEIYMAECVILARAFMEKVINYCYLIVCDGDEYSRFMKYSTQKSYRKLNRSIAVDDIKLSVKVTPDVDMEGNEFLKESLEEFTSEKGKEKTRWTAVNLQNRIKTICERSHLKPHGFMMNLLSIYGDASEALHGTLYGCSFHTGAYDPSVNHHDAEEVKVNTEKNITLLLWGLGIAFHQVVMLLNEKNAIEDIANKSIQNCESSFVLMNSVLEIRCSIRLSYRRIRNHGTFLHRQMLYSFFYSICAIVCHVFRVKIAPFSCRLNSLTKMLFGGMNIPQSTHHALVSHERLYRFDVRATVHEISPEGMSQVMEV